MRPKEFPDRQRLYDAGKNDTEIARALGIKRNTVTVWRRYRNLPSNHPAYAPTAKSRTGMYRMGWSDARIASELGVTRCCIRLWRVRRGLAPNFRQGESERLATGQRKQRREHPLMARVRKAVGRGLSRDIADDIVAEILLAILEGKLDPERIEAEARSYSARVLGTYASRFGARSLDQQLGHDEGYTLLERLADPAASNWLEEMGATVW